MTEICTLILFNSPSSFSSLSFSLHPSFFLSLSASFSLWAVSTKTCFKVGLIVTMTTLRGRVFLLLFSSSVYPFLSSLPLSLFSLYLSIPIYLSLFHPIHSQGIRKYQRKNWIHVTSWSYLYKCETGGRNRFLVARIRSFYSIKSWINPELILN